MDPILYRSESGRILLRSGVTAVFFVRGPIAEVGSLFQKTFQAWLDFVPPEGKKWCLIGNAESDKPFDKANHTRCLAQIDPSKAQKRGGGAFGISGPEDTCGEWSCTFSLRDRVDGRSPRCHYVVMMFPLKYAEATGTDELIDFLLAATQELPIDFGYVSRSLNFPDNLDLAGARDLIAPLAMRHPGYDVAATSGSSMRIGGRCRGARWVTFLGPEQVAALGGAAALAQAVPPGLTVRNRDRGTLLRAGPTPELGDVNRGDGLPLLRALARQLEPVTLFGDTFLDSVLGARREAWERRFLD